MKKGSGTPERESPVTSESDYRDRRRILQSLGLGTVALAAASVVGCDRAESAVVGAASVPDDVARLYPARANPGFAGDPEGRVVTPEERGTGYVNFYEFTQKNKQVAALAKDFVTRPWTVTIDGLVRKPKTLDVDDIQRRFALEERVYRMRCVEAWSMVLPWTGFPMRALLDAAEPLGSAKYVRFVTFLRPEQAPGQKNEFWYPWPYYEALSIDEAAHDLSFIATGLYGKPLPIQNGAPIRTVLPWKYGYKSIKSVVRIEFLEERPRTFWNDVAPREYDWDANVDPTVPHPRWSQQTEVDLGTKERIPTQPFNGYGATVAGLYR